MSKGLIKLSSMKSPRKLIINNQLFLWRRVHIHPIKEIEKKCLEKLIVYRAGFKKAPLIISFKENETWHVGYPKAGVIWCTDPYKEYNLNQPSVIAKLIQYILKNGWQPQYQTSPLLLKMGFQL